MIIEKLHEQFNNLTQLRVRSIKVDQTSQKVACVLSYPDVACLDSALRAKLVACVKSQVPSGYSCNVTFADDFFTAESFKQYLLNYFKSEYPLFCSIKREQLVVTVDGKTINLQLEVGNVDKLNFEQCNFCESLISSFADYSCYALNADIVLSDNYQTNNLEELDKRQLLTFNRHFLKPTRTFTVFDVEKYIGKLIDGSPMYISDIRKPMESCVLCGVISGKSTSVSKKNSLCQFTKFILTDESGASIPCVLFTHLYETNLENIIYTENVSFEDAQEIAQKRVKRNDNRLKKTLFLNNDVSVVVRGKVSLNDYSGKLEMMVYDLCKCQIAKTVAQPKVKREANPNYLLVEPQVYVHTQQQDLFATAGQRSILSDKNIVILQCNTTGYDFTKDKIFAISGIKIKNELICEKFFTYVNPELELDDNILSKYDIANTTLSSSPTLTELIGDLYKFCYDCTIICDDVAKLLSFLNYYASPYGYYFVNESKNTASLLEELFANANYEKVPNCTKITDVMKACKVNVNYSAFCDDCSNAIANCIVALCKNCK